MCILVIHIQWGRITANINEDVSERKFTLNFKSILHIYAQTYASQTSWAGTVIYNMSKSGFNVHVGSHNPDGTLIFYGDAVGYIAIGIVE